MDNLKKVQLTKLIPAEEVWIAQFPKVWTDQSPGRKKGKLSKTYHKTKQQTVKAAGLSDIIQNLDLQRRHNPDVTQPVPESRKQRKTPRWPSEGKQSTDNWIW